MRTNANLRGSLIASLALTIIGFLLSAPAYGTDWVSRQVTDIPEGATRPSLHSGQIAFESNGYIGIWFLDETGSPSTLIKLASSGSCARIYSGEVVYDTSGTVYWWNDSGPPQALFDGRWPIIHDGKITYIGGGGLYLWDGVQHLPISTTSEPKYGGNMYGDRIGFEIGSIGSRDVYLWDNGTTHQITNTPGDELYATPYGNQLAWMGHDGNDWEVYFRSDALDPSTQVNLTDNSTDEDGASLWNGRVAWSSWDGSDWEIMYWNGSSIEQVTNNDVDDKGACLDGGMIAYYSIIDGTTQIMLAQVPEPSVLVLLGVGLLTLLKARKVQ